MKNTTEKKECYYCKVGWTPIGGYHTITNCPPIGTASSVSIKCPMPMKKQNKKECDCCKCYCERCKDCRREPCTVHISSPNQVSWEERFDEEFDCKCGDMGIPHIRFDMSGSETIKAFIRSLLKEERQRVIDRVQEEMYEKDPNETDTQIMDRLWELLKELEVSKLSKGKV